MKNNNYRNSKINDYLISLEKNNDKFVKFINGDIVSVTTITKMKQLVERKIMDKALFRKLFIVETKTKVNKKGTRFIFDMPCSTVNCSNVEKIELTFTRAADFIINKKIFLCKKCSDDDIKEKNNKQATYEKKWRVQRENNLIRHEREWETYINYNYHWRNKNMYNNFRLLYNQPQWVSELIKGMDYKDFLRTPYWKAISYEVKRRAKFKCMFCNSSNNLNVHHRSYENHGDELNNLQDLVCLCNVCHEKHHNQ